MFNYKSLLIVVASLLLLPAFSEVKWKKYETATFAVKEKNIEIVFDQKCLSGIQTFVPLKKGKYKVNAILQGDRSVFFAIYSNRKWIYSPSYFLTKDAKNYSFEFSLNIDGNHCVAILARKKTGVKAIVSNFFIEEILEGKDAKKSPIKVQLVK